MNDYVFFLFQREINVFVFLLVVYFMHLLPPNLYTNERDAPFNVGKRESTRTLKNDFRVLQLN